MDHWSAIKLLGTALLVLGGLRARGHSSPRQALRIPVRYGSERRPRSIEVRTVSNRPSGKEVDADILEEASYVKH